MAGDWTTYLLRYGELGIKSHRVRRRFEKQLEDNLQAHFTRAGATCVLSRTWGRIYLETPDPSVARHAISHTFGLVSGSPTIVVDADLATIEATIRDLAPDHVSSDDSFAIRARRTGNHDFQSPDIGERGGAAVLAVVPDATVDLDDPDVEIHVEVRDAHAYVFTEIIAAPGGLPMGSQGKVVVPFVGPRSPAAAWMCMRRGASVLPLVPAGCEPVVETLEPWGPRLTYEVIEAPISREGLIEAADELATRVGANAVALGEHERQATTAKPLSHTVLRPLAGLPGRRWPQGAYQVAKDAADAYPQPCTSEDGEPPASALELLDRLEERRV